MPIRSIDLVAPGPPPRDPYEPSATAWALAAAYAAHGSQVRVLHPEGAAGAPPPSGTTPVPVPLSLKHPGAAAEGAEFAEAAGRRVKLDVDLIVRDPSGLGALGTRGRPTAAPIVAFVRAVELRVFDREHLGHPPPGWVDRLDRWRDRRSLRRLEQAALREADLLFADAPDLSRAVTEEYEIPERRWRSSVPPVAELPVPESRAAARAALGIPPDVPVVVAPAAEDQAGPAGIERAREVFRRVRPFFPGVRLVVVGTTVPVDPGVVGVPGRDSGMFGLALTAANVALFTGSRAVFDPMVVAAMRAECAVAAAPAVRLPIDPNGAVQYAVSDDPGDLASTLAELLADPAQCRELSRRGASHATNYAPDRVRAAVEAALPGGRA